MTRTSARRLRPWQVVLLSGFFLCVLYAFGSFTFDLFAGAATPAAGDLSVYKGVGMYFTYIESYFLALVVVLPILLVRRFGVGVLVYLPYAILGLGVEFYMERVATQALLGPLAVVGWCVIGLLIGLCADLAHRFLPSSLSDGARGALIGIVQGGATFGLTLLALSYFYVSRQVGPGSYLGQAWYGVPWLVLSSGFGGYTAALIANRGQ